MCGIAGWITSGSAAGSAAGSVDRQDRGLRAMLDRLAPRGPDGEGTFATPCDGGTRRLVLGHRRLAIIDPALGAQPMLADGGRLALVFNGEIYNYVELRRRLTAEGHRFATGSDTEVLLRAYDRWGADCVEHLRGMFAFALWDAERQLLMLARDRFGKKPLYLWEGQGEFAFASETKALLALPRVDARLDPGALDQFLRYRYVPGPRTLFQGITKLMPGRVLIRRWGENRERTFYRPPDGHVVPDRHLPADAVSRFRMALEEAVRLRMRSDVPFGAFLSGGLDSSSIVALMARESALPVNTFSVGFEGDDREGGELPYARAVARRFATRHHEIVLGPQEFADLTPAVVHAMDAPVTEPSTVPLHALSRLAARHVKMVLSGEGADEFLAGYPKHRVEPWLPAVQRLLPQAMRGSLLPRLADALPEARRRQARILAASSSLDDPRQRYPRWFGALTAEEAGDLLHPICPGGGVDEAYPFDAEPGTSALRRILYFDQTSWLPDNLLERGDRVTMAAGIEARMPFMDHVLAELVAGWPDRARLRGTTGKWVLRQAMAGDIPPEVLSRPKAGFPMPVGGWIRGPLKPWFADHLLASDARSRGFVRREGLAARFEEHVAGKRDHTKLLWILLSLELFLRNHGIDCHGLASIHAEAG